MTRVILFAISLIAFNSGFSQTWQELNAQVTLLFNRGEYTKAIPIAEQAIDAAKKEFGENQPNYASSINNLALLYSTTGQFQKAEPLYLQAVEISRKNAVDNKLSLATNLNNLALFYVNVGRYEKAEPLYLEAKEIRRKSLGEKHPDYAVNLYHIGSLYSRMGKYPEAESALIESANILKGSVGDTDVKHSFPLNALAELYRKIGKYKNAESYFLETITIRKKISGQFHPYYATSLINLADLYSDMDEYQKSEDLYLQAIEINRRALGENHPDYAAALNGLAELYRKIGQYQKAEPIDLQVLGILKNALGENHANYAVALNNLASLYQQIGQYQKAESLYLQAIGINKSLLGDAHPEYAVGLNNLGELYRVTGQLEKAVSAYTQAEEILEKSLGENHPAYAMVLNNLAAIFVDMGKYELAEALYKKAIEIKKQAVGENSESIAIYLNNLAYLYRVRGELKKAEDFCQQSLELIKRKLGEQHPDYVNGLNNLAGLYLQSGEFSNAEPLFIASNTLLRQNTLNVFAILSEKEKGNFLEMNHGNFDMTNSLLYYEKNNSPLVADNFKQLLFLKSLTLFDTRNILRSVYQSTDTTTRRLFAEWQSAKIVLSRQYSLALDKRRQDLKNLEARAEALEKELNRRSPTFQHQQNSMQVSVKNLKHKLQSDEAVIEFARFHLYQKGWTDSVIYAAYVLTKNDSIPKFVPLCEERQLQKFFQTGSAEKIKAIYRSDVVDEKEDNAMLGDSLYALIWKPLLPYLEGIKKVNYSPAGLLYKIAFHALPVNDKDLLLDKYQLHQLVSSKEILNEQQKNISEKNSILFGNCTFTMDSASFVQGQASGQSVSNMFSSGISRGSSAGWQNLPGTAEEVTLIHSLFEKNKLQSVVYSQQQATEERFKSLSGNSPTFIHLATHGFFLPDPEKKRQEGISADSRNSFTIADDPLLRSGIVLSGANRVWEGLPPIEGREDGIVTAYEISQLNLNNTELVVLSACETALGDTRGNEGVFGLQRAFKLAGVKNMILSLWSVPDKETAELMSAFYSYYIAGRPIATAFSMAQKDMRSKYKPYFWAAFVLIE